MFTRRNIVETFENAFQKTVCYCFVFNCYLNGSEEWLLQMWIFICFCELGKKYYYKLTFNMWIKIGLYTILNAGALN